MTEKELLHEMREAGINPRIVDPTALVPHPKNYNTHPQEQVDQIQASIDSPWKQYKNIVIWQRDGVDYILAGHGFVDGAIQAGKTKIVVNDRSDLTPEYAEKLLVSDNATPFLALPDTDKLNALLGSLPDFNDIPGVTDEWIRDMGVEKSGDDTSKSLITEDIHEIKRIHILISFPTNLYPAIQQTLESIMDMEGLEYRQSGN